jgi:hypothetical protein
VVKDKWGKNSHARTLLKIRKQGSPWRCVRITVSEKGGKKEKPFLLIRLGTIQLQLWQIQRHSATEHCSIRMNDWLLNSCAHWQSNLASWGCAQPSPSSSKRRRGWPRGHPITTDTHWWSHHEIARPEQLWWLTLTVTVSGLCERWGCLWAPTRTHLITSKPKQSAGRPLGPCGTLLHHCDTMAKIVAITVQASNLVQLSTLSPSSTRLKCTWQTTLIPRSINPGAKPPNTKIMLATNIWILPKMDWQRWIQELSPTSVDQMGIIETGAKIEDAKCLLIEICGQKKMVSQPTENNYLITCQIRVGIDFNSELRKNPAKGKTHGGLVRIPLFRRLIPYTHLINYLCSYKRVSHTFLLYLELLHFTFAMKKKSFFWAIPHGGKNSKNQPIATLTLEINIFLTLDYKSNLRY